MKNYILLSFAASLLFIQANAQDITSKNYNPVKNNSSKFNQVDLNNYKLTEFRYNQLNTNANLNSQNTQSKSSYQNNPDSENDRTYFSTNGSLNFYSRKETRRYQGYQSASAGFSSSLEKSEYHFTDTTKQDEQYNNVRINLNTTNYFYFNNNLFFKISDYQYLSRNSGFVSEKNTNTNTNEKEESDNISVDNELSLGFGIGRIENVSDARLALYILDDLNKFNRLSKIPTQEEVFEFADFLTKEFNKRIIDDRIKQIEQSMAIDSFLISKGWVSKNDGLFFGLVKDNCMNSRLYVWNTGQMLEFQFTPGVYYYKSTRKNYEDDVQIDKSWFENINRFLDFNLNYKYSKVLSLKWLHNYSIQGGFALRRNEYSPDYYVDINEKSVYLHPSYSIAFMPNTRTQIITNIGLIGEKYFVKESTDYYKVNSDFDLQCTYYISPKLRLSASGSIYNDFMKYSGNERTNQYWNYSLQASLSYAFF